MKPIKKVSVVIPAYNKADFTIKTIESVLRQTYKNIEIIVIDDGSKDSTREKIIPYLDRIKYLYKENGGACSARNLGIRLSSGEYIALIDCDDMYLPNKIEKSIEYLEKSPGIGFVYTSAYFIDEKEARIRRYPFFPRMPVGWIAKKLVQENFICNSTVVVRKECFEKVGYFDESIFIPADWDMWLRLSESYKVGYIKEPLTLYRASSSYILRNLDELKKECFIVMDKAFRRNQNLNRNALLSNVYYLQALGYLKINEIILAKKELILALRQHMFNFHALVLLILVKLLRRNSFMALSYLKII